MKKIIVFLVFLIAIGFFAQCTDQDDKVVLQQPTCDSSNTTFNQLYNDLLLNSGMGYADFESVGGGEVHSYDFEVTSAKTICKIGYRSQTAINATPYLIEILDNNSNTVIYSGSNVFSDTVTSYVSIPPITLNVGVIYTIRRIQTNWGGNVANKSGRMLCNAAGSFNFPLVMGALKITNPKLYDVGSSQNDSFALPYIDIVFEN